MTDKKNDRPFVLVLCMTYNHEAYIEDALNGFVLQKTDFPFVVSIIDDASTDNNTSVIMDYLKRVVCDADEVNPKIEECGKVIDATPSNNPNCSLHVVFLSENHFGKRSKRPYYIQFEEKAKYIAMCEGDDYWTDPYKLQKQVDFMEAHLECSVSFHRCKHLNTYINQWSDDGLEKYIINNEPTEISIPQFFKHWCTQPLTMMYRRSSYDTSIRAKYNHFWDMYFIYHLLCAGKGYLLPFVGGVHIIQANGMSGGLQSDVQRCEFELISADELHAVNHNKYTKKYWQDTVIWSWNTFEHSGEKQKLRGLILKEWRQFPCDMTEVMWIQTKRMIKNWMKK